MKNLKFGVVMYDSDNPDGFTFSTSMISSDIKAGDDLNAGWYSLTVGDK